MAQDNNDNLNFCTKCGGPLVLREAGGYLRKACIIDGNGHYVHWNNPKPVAIAIIPRPGGKVLFIRRGIEPGKGKWALPGGYGEGYKEPGVWAETVEENAIREVREEAGVNITIARYRFNFTPKNDSNSQVHVVEAHFNADPAQAGDEVLEVADFGPDDLPQDEVAFPSHLQIALQYFKEMRNVQP